MANLSKKVEIGAKNTGWGGIGLVCGYNLECSLILLNDVWVTLEEELGGDIVFIVPAKDIVVFANGKIDENVNNLNRDIKKIGEIYKDDPRMLLSKKVYRYKDGLISVV